MVHMKCEGNSWRVSKCAIAADIDKKKISKVLRKMHIEMRKMFVE